MNIKSKIVESAARALHDLFQISDQDKTLILYDTDCESIADAFRNACTLTGCELDVYWIDERDRPLKEIPEGLTKMLSGKSIVLNIIKAYPEEIPFRIKWIFKVEENKQIKMGHMPGITETMMLGSVNIDYLEMQKNVEILLKSLKGARQIHITTDEGTDLILGVRGRIFVGDVGVKAGEMCNLPCGEIYCAPLETEANGIVVFNASVGDIGLLNTALKVYLENGKIKKFESEDFELVKKINELQNVDDDSMVIGELGIGVNPKAQITGNMLEDEKAFGTAHLAFGNNADFPGGGKNNSKIHRDYLFFAPTIDVIYPDNTNKLIMQKGRLT